MDEAFEQDLRRALKADAYSSPMPDHAALVARVRDSHTERHGWHLAAVAVTAAAAVVVAVIGLSLAGRLPDWEIAAPGASPSSASPSPTQPTPVATPSPDRTGQIQTMWILHRATGTDVLIGVETSCTGGYVGADVSETETTVDIKAWVAPLSGAGCPLARVFHAVTVPLDAPIGDRELTGCLLRNSKAYDPRTECSQSYDGASDDGAGDPPRSSPSEADAPTETEFDTDDAEVKFYQDKHGVSAERARDIANWMDQAQQLLTEFPELTDNYADARLVHGGTDQAPDLQPGEMRVEVWVKDPTDRALLDIVEAIRAIRVGDFTAEVRVEQAARSLAELDELASEVLEGLDPGEWISNATSARER